jgi:N-acetylmuramoyl-L-alanine amidase
MRVMIDPGHGGNTAVGGSSANNARGPAGTLEKDLTLAIAGRVRDALAPCGTEIHLTRYVDQNLGLADRAALAADLDADVFLSIHLNAAEKPDGTPDPTVNGTETWVHTLASAESKELARAVQAAAVRATGLRDRGVRAKNLGVLDPPGTSPTRRPAWWRSVFSRTPRRRRASASPVISTRSRTRSPRRWRTS